MANYSNLRAVIAANIYQNNNNEVTADMVKTAMDAVVACIGNGYLYKGVATPATDPSTPDEKVFYLASEAGTYTNFGGIVVAAGEVAIIKGSGSSWSKDATGINAMNASPDTINGGTKLSQAGKVVANVADQADLQILQNALVDADFELMTPDNIITGRVANDTGTVSSGSYNIWVYAIVPDKNYMLHSVLPLAIDRRSVYYSSDAAGADIVGWDKYKGDSSTTATQHFDGPLTIPEGANYILLNVRHVAAYERQCSILNIDREPLIKVRDFVPASIKDSKRMKCVVNADGTFHIRFALSDTQDGILTFNYCPNFDFVKSSLMQAKFYVGGKNDTDDTILAGMEAQNCYDSQAPMNTENVGPLFANHGYCTPRVRVPGNTLTDADLGSEWIDQNDYHYTLIHIGPSGEWLYLLPVIDTSGGPGYETRDWHDYSSDFPTQLTRNAPGGETLIVTDGKRYDYQVSELVGTRILIGGNPVGAGVYFCDEVVLSYRQVGYNPYEVSAWWPTPVYGGVMLYFDRNFTMTGGEGFLSLTTNTIINNKYPYRLRTYTDEQPMFPLQFGDYVPYMFIPKLKKVDANYDFREEFAAPANTSPVTNILRNATDLVDVDDLPDRAYCYLKDGDGNILFGCAGGHSLVRGMSIKSVRDEHIALGDRVGTWSPSSGNKLYTRVMMQSGEQDNMLPSSFIGEFEGFMCWYMPRNGVQVFYHRTKEGYVVYIHTDTTAAKGEAVLPDFMNNYAVAQIVEKTADIDLLTDTIIDGKIYFANDSSVNKYNYVVFLVKP